MTRTSRLLDPEQIAVLAGRQMPFLRLPERATVFADRSVRLRQLAASHPMRDYLLFIAELASAQHEQLQHMPDSALPDAAACDAAAMALLPPLPAASWPRDPAWRDGLRTLLRRFLPRVPAGPARVSVQRVIDMSDASDASDAALEQQADRLLAGVMLGLDLAVAPLIAAGLQTYWVDLVLRTARQHGDSVYGRTDPATTCPCCGSAPTAGVVRIGAEEAGHRYLHCSLCSAQWHFVRIKCAHCESTKGVHYEQLEARGGAALPATGARDGAVRAECCDSCGRYLKLVSMERDAEVEPVADDLASVALDLLVSEGGHDRSGVNLMLLFGDPDPS